MTRLVAAQNPGVPFWDLVRLSDIDDAWETDSDECYDLDASDLDDAEDELNARCDEDDNENDEGAVNDVESLGYSAL